MKYHFVFSFLLGSLFSYAQPNSSGHTNLESVQFEWNSLDNGQLLYSVEYKNQWVVKPSSIGFVLSKPKCSLTQFDIIGIDSMEVNQNWSPVWGEEAIINNHYKQVIFHLKDKNGTGILIDFVCRLFKDGLGFRYEFPEQKNLQHFVVKDELTQFQLAGNHTAFWIPGDFDTNEYLYQKTLLSDIDAFKAATKEKDIAVTTLIDANAVQTPLMMKSKEGLYINIHEAALRNYPAMNLQYYPDQKTFQSVLVPDAVGEKAFLQTPAKTPWRTILVSDRVADLLASRTILNLNDPSVIKDPSFIRPQKFVGMWWEMHVGKATWQLSGGKHGANTTNVKRYIDFAAKHKFDGVLVEGWNEGWEDWFGNWKENVFDFVTPYKDYDVKYLTQYAKQKGVKIIMHHETSGAVTNYERRMDTAYRFMNRFGMDAVKTGYVGKIIPRGEHHDGQWMVNHYERVAQKTADYKIMLDAHEPVHPTGLHRTYPNWMANEAARGSEFNNAPTLGIPPEHTTILPFTRMMGGPMDFTPGLFHFKLNQFDSTRKTQVNTTLAKQLALYITMYSPLQMAADLPENYEKHLDAFQFIKDVPVDWSATKILDAEPGDYITIARKDKHSENWFIGSITDEHTRELSLSLDFLNPNKTYTMTIYRDAADAHYDRNPEAYVIETKTVKASDVLKVWLAAGGGCAVVLKSK